jgi:uncharacterized protein YkwD
MCGGQPKERGFTAEQRNSILALHNSYREKVRQGAIKGLPRPKTMPSLTWDHELEKEAQRYSNYRLHPDQLKNYQHSFPHRWADVCPDYDTGV